MPDVNDILREFDAVEANLKRLETLWDRLGKAIPGGIAFTTGSPEAISYEEDARAFRRILAVMPTVDGHGLPDCIMDLDDIAQSRLDAAELGEIECTISVEQSVFSQGAALREYRSRFQHQRRAFARGHVGAVIHEVTRLLGVLAACSPGQPETRVEHDAWEPLKAKIAELDVLLGGSITRPTAWSQLTRHLHFGAWADIRNIVERDWPEVKNGIEDGLYAPDEPLPVSVTDLNALATAPSSGDIVTRLKWDSLSAEDFERLIFLLLRGTEGYQNTDWIMKTNAQDSGRDVATWRILDDPLTGSRRERVIVQCRHWLSKSIGIDEIVKVKEQVSLWEPPPVDQLIVATSGRFTQDTVRWTEKHNHERTRPWVALWAESHLEGLLAARPDIVAELRLR